MEYLFCCQDGGEIYFASRMLFAYTEQKKTAKLWACCDLKKKKKLPCNEPTQPYMLIP